ncbi:MAG: D-alanyl-D-alanine carboxypeptidase family protein [Patescibacteria group bacterium]
MPSLILSLLLIPFAPLWFYGNIVRSDISENTAPCDQAAGICRDVPRVEGARDFKGAEETDGKNKNFQKASLFPVDTAAASGFVPVKKENASELKIWAGGAVAIDVDSGTILYYDEGRKRTQIASLTKMMTAILVMEKMKDLEEEVAVTKEALLQPGTVVGCPTSTLCSSNRMYTGEKVKAADLLKAMLMNSANDAATALGIQIAGSPDNFVEMMNVKAKELGLKDTHFCTPSGLEIDGQEDRCYSSAYDIARIAAYSLQYEKIWEIMRIPEGRFYSADGKYMHELKSTDLIMDSTPNYLGVKTGFTPLAGKSLLAGATDPAGKRRIIAVVLNDDKRWEDMKALTDWIFASYKWQ